MDFRGIIEGVNKLNLEKNGLKEVGNKFHIESEKLNDSKLEMNKKLENINTKGFSINSFEEEDRPLYSHDVKENTEILGGRYRDVFKEGLGDKYEVHHMPPDSVNGIERLDGPAIRMEKEDHRQTASCGNSIEARMYRSEQKELIEKGDFKTALQMDIDDIHSKFGDKYDKEIEQMKKYAETLY